MKHLRRWFEETAGVAFQPETITSLDVHSYRTPLLRERGYKAGHRQPEALLPVDVLPLGEDRELTKWLFGDVCEATDGYAVKPDSVCPHGHLSWLLRKEMI